MSEPSREHVEAVAQWLIGETPLGDYSPDQQAMIWEDAASMLANIPEPMLDAMQDALVRAGRLHLQVMRRRCSCGVANTFCHVMSDEHHALPDKVRYITEWQEIKGGDDAA